MSDYKYSLKEIDTLRDLVRNKYLWNSYRPKFGVGGRSSESYNETSLVKMIEEEAKTLIIAGVYPEDIK